MDSKEITTIFFDLDNTLIPTRKGDLKAIKKLSEILEINYDMSREDAQQSTASYLATFRQCPDKPGVPLDEWRSSLWEQALPAAQKPLKDEIYVIWLNLRYKYVTVTPAIVAMLTTLRQKYLLAVITNGPSAAQWEKIHKIDLNKYFDCVLVSDDMPWCKPDPNIFYAACHYLQVRPQQCIMIGDKLETDIQGGIASNLAANIWLPLAGDDTQMAVKEDAPHPDYIVNNVLELMTLLPRMDTDCPPCPIFRARRNNLKRRPHNRIASLPELECSNSNESNMSDGS